jgi:hypothetical protein
LPASISATAISREIPEKDGSEGGSDGAGERGISADPAGGMLGRPERPGDRGTTVEKP